MEAWRCGNSTDLSDLELAQVPRPSQDQDLILKVEAAALNFSDILMVQDRYQIKPPRPFTPGQEVAGTVTFAPEDCGYSVGDKVASKVNWGGFADYVAVPPTYAFSVPPSLSMTQAAALPVSYLTALVGLTECSVVQADDWVLVNAASGAVGLAAVEVAKTAGANVIAAASTPEKRTLATMHGADSSVDYTAPDWIKKVKSLTGGHGVDIIFDPVGGDIGEQSLHALARDGTILIVGFASGRIQSLPANRLLLKRASAKGVYWNHDQDKNMMKQCNQRLAQMLDRGQISPEITVYPGLESLPEALDDLKNRRSTGKLVLDLQTQETDQ